MREDGFADPRGHVLPAVSPPTTAIGPQPRLAPTAGAEPGLPRWQLVDAQPPAEVGRLHRGYVLGVLTALLFTVVLGQRLVVPLGSFPVALPLVATYVAVVLLRFRGGVRYNRVRTELYLLAVGTLLLATWFNTFAGASWSVNSLLLLLVLYLPWVFCLSPQYRELFAPLMRRFVGLMSAVALVAIAQMATQFAGLWTYQDYMLEWLPPNWFAADYNTSFPMSYLSPIYKANAFLFLEPSFLCQFLGLAVIVALVMRLPAWQPLLLGIGMACTLSGTGILLLAAGLVVLVFRRPSSIRPSYLVAGALGIVIIFQTPAAEFLLDRRTETTQQGSSGYLRFVQPYTEVLNGLADEPERYLYGAGPGSADRLLVSGRTSGEAVVYTIAPKLAFEYGLIAAVVFSGFLLVAILRGPPVHVIPAAVIVMIFFLSGSLLQPFTIVTAWLMTSIWGQPVAFGLTDSLAARRRQRQMSPG